MHLPKATETITLSEFHFCYREYGKLFSMIKNLHGKGDVIDRVMLGVEVESADIGISMDELLDIYDEVPHGGNIPFYANNVREAYNRRELAKVVDTLNASVHNPTTPIEEVISSAKAKLETIGVKSANHLIHVQDAVEAVYENLFGENAEDERSFSTGMAKMDDECGLWKSGEMIVLAARPGCGKTSLALQIAEHFAERDRHVLFTSLEMDDSELVKRALAAHSGIQARQINRGLSDENAQKVRTAMARVSESSMTFFVPPKTTMDQIRSAAKITQGKHELGLLVIDYLGLIRGDKDIYRKVTEHSQAVKALARELKVPVLILSQLNRSADGQTPTLAHLRDSGAIEQDADRVIFLSPEDWETSRRESFNLIVAKNRNGPTMLTKVNFDGERMRFVNPNFNPEFSRF